MEITDTGSTVYGDPTQGPFDGVEDTLIGVVNHSSQPVGALALTSSTDLFGFDGDGICAYGVGPCGPTGYEGPNTSFSDISPDTSNGVVSFPAGLVPGASTYFALEESLSTANLVTGTGQSPVTAAEVGQAPNPRVALVECSTAKPINCATGDFWHTFTDLSIPGRGPALNLQRTYSAFGHAGDGMFGFGWSGTYGMRAVADAAGNVTVSQENGSTITFTANGAGGFTAPSRVMASLVSNADGTRTMIDTHGGLTHTFAAAGQLLSVSDRNGYTTTLTYSGTVLATVSDPAGRTLTFTTDTAGHVTKVTDPAGRAVTYTYDAAGNQASATDPAGGTWAYTYDAAHQMLTMTDPRGGAVTNTYDAAGRVTVQSDALGRMTTLAYTGDPSTSAGSTTTITDPVGNATTEAYQQLQMQSITHGAGTPVAATTTFSYDPFTLGLASTTDPDSHTTTYTWDRRGNQTSSTDPLGRTATTTWTGLNEPSAITDPAGNTTTFGYDARGNLTGQYRSLNGSTTQAATLTYASATFPGDVTSMTDPNGKTSTMVYDANGDLTLRTDPVGDVTTFGYDAIGRRTTAVSARGNVAGGSPSAFTTTYAFDPDGALTTSTDPLGHVTRYGYDANHNQTTVTDPLGHVTTSTFDADNEVTTVTRADGTTVTTAYNGDGKVTGQTDGLHNTTTYTYDALGRVSATHDPLGRATTVGYDPAGHPITKTDATGLVTTVAYDAAGRRTSIHYSDTATPSVTFAYTVDGQRASMTDATGVTSYTYDALNRLTGQTDGAGQVMSYGYDLAGHVTALTYPNAQVVTRGYDDAGRLHTITDWLGHTTTLSLDPDSNPASTVYGNGVTSAATFNNADQMTATTDTGPAGAALASFTYTRDSNGQLTSTTPTGVTQGNETYPYTLLNQLAGVGTSTYTYDAADNITRLLNGNTLSYDAANQPTTATPSTGPATTFSYDQRGNRTNATTPAATTMSVDVTKSKDSTSGTNPTVTTGTFSTTATNEVLLALVSSDGPATAPQTETVAGAGLTWTLVTRANTQAGDAEIWKATAPTVLTGVSVHATQSATGFHQTLTVIAVKGATGVGASAHASAPTGAPTLTVTTTAPGSLVFATGHDWDSATARTLGAGQGLIHEFSDTATLDDSWVQRTTNPVPATATTVTVNDTAPTTHRWDLTAVEITSPPTAPAVAAFTYNQANELTASTTPAGVSAGYTYDGDGLRATRTTPAATQKFAWALTGGLPVLLTDDTISYLYDDTGTPVEQIDTAGVALYYQHDQYGSTRLLTDAAGAVAATFSYDPYGNLTGHTGTADTPLRWNGQYQDTDTGLYYLRARYYDPTTAQFLTRDPLEALTGSAYVYAGGDPLNAADPLGLCAWYDAVCDARTPSKWNPVYDMVNAVAIIPYGEYYVSYRTLSSAGSIPVIGPATTIVTPLNTLYATQYLGLTADEGIDAFKNWFFHNGESTRDEGGPIYPTSVHFGPEIYGPGVHGDGRKDLYPAHSYPWSQGFDPSRDPNCG